MYYRGLVFPLFVFLRSNFMKNPYIFLLHNRSLCMTLLYLNTGFFFLIVLLAMKFQCSIYLIFEIRLLLYRTLIFDLLNPPNLNLLFDICFCNWHYNNHVIFYANNGNSHEIYYLDNRVYLSNYKFLSYYC